MRYLEFHNIYHNTKSGFYSKLLQRHSLTTVHYSGCATAEIIKLTIYIKELLEYVSIQQLTTEG